MTKAYFPITLRHPQSQYASGSTSEAIEQLMMPPEEEFMVMEKENTPVDVSAKHMQRALFEETVAVDNTV